eukprot:6212495-Pleurochrysis_carterae.AAC.1
MTNQRPSSRGSPRTSRKMKRILPSEPRSPEESAYEVPHECLDAIMRLIKESYHDNNVYKGNYVANGCTRTGQRPGMSTEPQMCPRGKFIVMADPVKQTSHAADPCVMSDAYRRFATLSFAGDHDADP